MCIGHYAHWLAGLYWRPDLYYKFNGNRVNIHSSTIQQTPCMGESAVRFGKPNEKMRPKRRRAATGQEVRSLHLTLNFSLKRCDCRVAAWAVWAFWNWGNFGGNRTGAPDFCKTAPVISKCFLDTAHLQLLWRAGLMSGLCVSEYLDVDLGSEHMPVSFHHCYCAPLPTHRHYPRETAYPVRPQPSHKSLKQCIHRARRITGPEMLKVGSIALSVQPKLRPEVVADNSDLCSTCCI